MQRGFLDVDPEVRHPALGEVVGLEGRIEVEREGQGGNMTNDMIPMTIRRTIAVASSPLAAHRSRAGLRCRTAAAPHSAGGPWPPL